MKIVEIIGGLGNQMFQYAFYIFLKNKYKNIYLNLDYFKRNQIHNGYELERIFNINKINKIEIPLHSKNIIWRIIKKIFVLLNIYCIEMSKMLQSKDINLIKKETKRKFEIFYQGGWVTEKYFSDFSKEIKEIFIFPKIDKTDLKNIEIIKKILTSESVSIHIRRGDYLTHKVAKDLAPLFYYKDAIKYISKKIKNPVFYIFSNDIEWCKENFKIDFPTYYIDWNNGEESFKDMQLMSLCKHNIIPNSTFSWWGAWLNNNPNKIVIAPEKWLNLEKRTYEDIVPETWIKIRNY